MSHNVAQLHFTFLTVSPGNCAVGGGARCSDVAAFMIAGSSPKLRQVTADAKFGRSRLIP